MAKKNNKDYYEKSKKYWEDREKEKINKGVKDCNKLAKELEVQYKAAAQYIEKEINNIFEKYSKDNELTYAEANKYLTSDEFKVWRSDIKGYLEMIEADEKALIELNTLSARSRITRWEALKSEVDKAIISLGSNVLESTTELLTDTLVDNYNKNMDNIAKSIGIEGALAGLDEKTVKSTLSYPWSGKDYKQRIGVNNDRLRDVLKEEMTQMLIRGEDTKAISSRISQRVNINYKETVRLVRTEHSYIMNKANLLTYEDLDVERYEFLATEDERECEICGKKDGKTYDLKEAQAGYNLPPMHPNCRCCTVAVTEDLRKKYEKAKAKAKEKNKKKK